MRDGACLFILLAAAQGYELKRREAVRQALGAAVGAFASVPAAQAVLSSKACSAGVGDGCSDLAGDNDFIKSLQDRSAANREQYAREARDAYYMKNYPDWFATVGKTLVKKGDGSFITVSDEELEDLKRENKITLEIPKTKGGKYTDLTQKPVLVLRE